MTNNFLPLAKLRQMGVKLLGSNIQISANAILHNPAQIQLKDNVRIDDGVVLSAHGAIEIGNYVHLARGSLFYSGSKIIISDFCTVSSDCKFYGMTDNYNGSVLIGPTCPEKFRTLQKGPIILQPYAAVGTSCVLLPNSILKEGAVVGALSLVRGELEEWSIYGGNPLVFLKKRLQLCKALGQTLL